MLHNDIVKAQRIVSGAEYNFGNTNMFHNSSAVYKISNERIQDYEKYLRKRNKVLSVIGSGDQILNCILNGTKDIDAFDISVFPKYFLELKMAAIKALTIDEYIDFFYEVTNRDEVYEDMYYRIAIYLGNDICEFWDSLFNFFEWKEIYNSTIFSSEPNIASNAINQNKFLQSEEEYNRLREELDNVKISYYEGDILELSSYLRESYDLVYLSNIVYYCNKNKYKEMLGNLNLTDKGISLTYFYKMQGQAMKYFQGTNISFEKFDTVDSGIMISSK